MKKSAKKSWKAPLNLDDDFNNKSFLSLLGTGSFNINSSKDSIRKYAGSLRSALSDADVVKKSLLISDNIITLDIFKLSKSIALYYPIHKEVRTELIFKIAVKLEKEVYFPRVNGSSLDFHWISNLEQLKPGKFGVLEPDAKSPKTDIDKIDLFILPGLAFDKSGNRIGFGQGYYDRALSEIPQQKKLGIAYSFQLLDSLPAEENDRKVGTVITDEGIVFSRRNLGGI